MSHTRVAVVTGSNKGIGLAIVKALCQKFDGDVFLTARDESRGKQAVSELEKTGLHPKFHLLDINDLKSIQTLRDFLKTHYKGLDVLVNNAAIAFKNDSTVPDEEQVKETIRVNFFANRTVCHELFPLLRPHARVVNISSSEGMLSKLQSTSLKQKFSSPDLKEEELCELINQYIKDVHDGKSGDWGRSKYAVSKVAVTALSFIQQRAFNKDSREDIIVNPVHPGYVDTDMTSHKGPLSTDQGAEAPVYAALLPPNTNSPKGEFIWFDKTTVPWK